MSDAAAWKFWIDTGGTFTDCLAEDPERRIRRIKTLSSSALRGRARAVSGAERQLRLELPYDLPDGFLDGYALRWLGEAEDAARIVGWSGAGRVATLDREADPGGDRPCEARSPEESPALAARILTGKGLGEALPPLEMRLATTRGTNALLERRGARLALFVTRGFADLLRIGSQRRPRLFELGIRKDSSLPERVYEVSGRLAADGSEVEPIDEAALRESAEACVASGAEAAAVALLHSYRNPEHEERVAAALRKAGVRRVALSSRLAPMAKILPRAHTAAMDGYLSTVMERYLDAVAEGIGDSSLRVMTSAGGLVGRKAFHPKDSLFSGPAGGVAGASSVALAAGYERSVAFDMGGTSSDVSRFDGRYDLVFERSIGAARVFAPSLQIDTVAAGGGSVCWFDGDALRVGPRSAGADPGPACYGAGGPLALTDVNLLLGRLDPSAFSIPLDPSASRERLLELSEETRRGKGEALDERSLLEGFLAIANERMAEAIAGVSTRRGYDVSTYALVAAGGAGGLHACALAEQLGMRTILCPADSGLLSAYGLKMARLERFAERQVLQSLEACWERIAQWVAELEREAQGRLLREEALPEAQARLGERGLELRYLGQEATLRLDYEEGMDIDAAFREAYRERFGMAPGDLEVEVVALRVSAVSEPESGAEERFEGEGREVRAKPESVIDRASLKSGDWLRGPAAIQDAFSTAYVAAGWRASTGSSGTLRMEREEAGSGDGGAARPPEGAGGAEAVALELFGNRFASVVEEMGGLLERTAFSTNVKERRDFSCALLDRDGRLVANAPHIPVHLGALGVCLRETLERLTLGPGDVAVTNHPAFGGSHLPDVTLLAAVFAEDGETLLGYVANRAHHAELGGIAPGSMPPLARSLAEEGVVIAPAYLARRGEVDFGPLERLLAGGPRPTRALEENLADLRAQLASLRLGQRLLRELAASEGTKRVIGYLAKSRERAANALRRALEGAGVERASASQRMEDGAEIRALVERRGAGWTIDFAGSAPQRESSYNATPAVVTSAVLYVLRLLAREEMPLNEGFLDVAEIRLPEGSFLRPRFPDDPSACPPVVAGNVEVSQRVVDTLLLAFGLAACSQGTMNNLVFGDDRFSYYETIAGGEGATPERDGADAVHTHMTNTAITDAEILELRYPARLERFAVRRGSGGAGRHRGGDGVARRIRFLAPMTVSMLTQRRSEGPEGLEGGEPGEPGRQRLLRADGSEEALPADVSIEVEAGDAIEVETPGGGGWGESAAEAFLRQERAEAAVSTCAPALAILLNQAKRASGFAQQIDFQPGGGEAEFH